MSLISGLNKAFDHRIRLGIMSILMVNEWATFNELKGYLEIPDGTLASHLKALEKANYMTFKKEFIGRKPQTSYSATEAGRKAFQAHLDALEKLLGKD
ncbi:MAG: transcriptional regulator [Bacteroidota bacterium]